MKPKNILIATAAILILTSLLSGCAKIEEAVMEKFATPPAKTPSAPKTAIQETVKMAQAAKKEVNLVFESEESDGKVKVTITLKNPNKKPITSVQNWLSFNPSKLKGEDMDVSESDFPLVAPYDNVFDSNNGLMMFGRASSTPITDETIHVAVVTFKVLNAEGATINVYDYREDLTGHTSANAMVDGKPYNILLKPGNPVVVITNQL